MYTSRQDRDSWIAALRQDAARRFRSGDAIDLWQATLYAEGIGCRTLQRGCLLGTDGRLYLLAVGLA